MKKMRFNELAIIIGGGTPKTSNIEYWNGDIPWISIKDFYKNKRYILNTEKNITKLGVENSSTKFLEKDDIIISARGTVGLISLVSKPMTFNQSCYGIKVREGINKIYFYYLLKYSFNLIKIKSYGSVFDTITTSTFDDITLNVLDLKKQNKISYILDLIDQKIELNNKINDNLEEQIKLIFEQWFINLNFLTTNNKSYKDSGESLKFNIDLNKYIPNHWEVKSILDIINWKTNTQPPKKHFINEPKEGYVRFIQNRDYSSDNHKTFIRNTKNLNIVNEFDILMDKYGEAGKTRYGKSGAFNVALAKIEPKLKNSREYIRSFLSQESIFYFLNNSCMASTRASLSEKNLIGIKLMIPDPETLIKYEKTVLNFRTKIIENNKENKKLEELRDFLLSLLMNGQATIED